MYLEKPKLNGGSIKNGNIPQRPSRKEGLPKRKLKNNSNSNSGSNLLIHSPAKSYSLHSRMIKSDFLFRRQHHLQNTILSSTFCYKINKHRKSILSVSLY